METRQAVEAELERAVAPPRARELKPSQAVEAELERAVAPHAKREVKTRMDDHIEAQKTGRALQNRARGLKLSVYG